MTKRKRQPESQGSAPAKWDATRLRRTPARQRPDILARPNALFEHLNKDIRNLAYDRLAFPPLVHVSDDPNGSSLLAVSREARQEALTIGLRRFWILLHKLPEKVGYNFKIANYLQGPNDLVGLKHLIITVQGPISGALPAPLQPLKRLQINTLTIHHSGMPPDKKDQKRLVMSARAMLCNTFDGYDDWHSKFSLKQFTLSWDYRRGKEPTKLRGNTFELTQEVKRWTKDQAPANVQRIHRWPLVVCATRRGEEGELVGVWRLIVGTRCATTTVGLRQLMVTVGQGRVADIGTQTMATEVVVQYEPIERHF